MVRGERPWHSLSFKGHLLPEGRCVWRGCVWPVRSRSGLARCPRGPAVFAHHWAGAPRATGDPRWSAISVGPCCVWPG
eukprot:4372311-Pyramimonas_sp.AAC.1